MNLLGDGFLLLGAAFILLGSLGLLRMPDVFNRLQAGTKSSTLGLIAFGHRLRTGDSRWMLAAGAAGGVALCFRLTPAFSLACGIGVAVMAASRSPRAWPSPSPSTRTAPK